jgi:hypothetical protein
MSGTVTAGTRALSSVVGMPAWTAMSLLNSWSNTSGEVAAQYRVWPLTNELEVIGAISHASISGGSQIATMTGTAVPNSGQRRMLDVWSATNVFASATATPHLQLQTSGVLQLLDMVAGTTSVWFHCWFSLDA